MPTLDKASGKWIMDRLDNAYRLGRKGHEDGPEPEICWDIRQVRDLLLSAMIVDLNVEAISVDELADLRETKPE